MVYTYDGNVSKLYINDKLAIADTIGAVSFNPNKNYLYLGKSENDNYPYNFYGVIDEVRIYNRALSAAEVTGLGKAMGKDN